MANELIQVQAMKHLISSEAMKKRVGDVLGKEAGTFLASVLDLYTSDGYLNKCDPNKVMAEAMKAAALRLPVSKSMGFCYVIPYGNIPQFQMGWKGFVQLAQRSGQYKYLNADVVYEGEHVTTNRLTGMVEITGDPISDKAVGYFAYFQMLNGFEKCIYWSKERVTNHAKKFSKSFKSGPWQDNFDAMAIKTVLKQLISKYGIMSVEMVSAFDNDDAEEAVEKKIDTEANTGEPLVIDLEEEQKTEAPKAEPRKAASRVTEEPDF